MSERLGKRGRASVSLALCACALAMAAEGRAPMFLINETPSLPKGLYLRSFALQPQMGSIVAVAQPPSARPYLASLGVPVDMWLLKRVAAASGDHVCAEQSGVSTPRRWAAVLERDRRGRALPRWRDCRVLAGGELFLLGDTVTSFDSRYFGPISKGYVAGAYHQVLRW